MFPASDHQTAATTTTTTQLFEHLSSTYTYILACPKTYEAIIIDPVLETVDRDLLVAKHMGVSLKYASKASGAVADFHFTHGDKLKFGADQELEVRSTPGHTDGCCTFVLHQNAALFTGDALLIGGCGRTDFQQGNAGALFDNVWAQILSLPDHYTVYPAHDYKGLTCTTVGEQKQHNPRLTKSKEQFVDIMNKLGLAYPKQIDKSVPANMVCGVYDAMDAKTQQAVKPSLDQLELRENNK